jgi:hypothetical protein
MVVQGSARRWAFVVPAYSPGASKTGEDRYSTCVTVRQRIPATLNIHLYRS